MSWSGRMRLMVLSAFVLCALVGAMHFVPVSDAFSNSGTVLPATTTIAGSPIFTNRAVAGVVDPASKVAATVLDDTVDGRRASVVIFLAEQADVRAAEN